MKWTADLFVCLLLAFSITGCSNIKSDTNPTTVDYTGASQFAKEKFSEYMNTLNIQDFDIVQASTALRTGNDNHFVCIIEASVLEGQGKQEEKFTYGFDIIVNDKREFEVLNQGKGVGTTYLIR
jgi:hypothetical protein